MYNTVFPFLGFGLGLRQKHYRYILKEKPQIDWFEVISENYMVDGGQPLFFLDQICERYPIVCHGVSLNLGSMDPLNKDYLIKLKKLAERVSPKWVSDHLCWTGVHGKNAHDLLPLPYNDETVKHVASRIKQTQDFLQRPILIENVSSYMAYKDSTMTEWEFLTAITQESGCYLLFDVNNIFVSAFNHGFDALDFLSGVPKDRVVQIHLAGHTRRKKYLLDTHDHAVCDGVWELYAEALKRFGAVSTMIERDDHIPAFSVLEKELNHAKKIYVGAGSPRPCSPGKNFSLTGGSGGETPPLQRQVNEFTKNTIASL